MKANDNLNYLGWGLFVLSLTLFLLPVLGIIETDKNLFTQIDHGGAFILSFGISIVYFILTVIAHIRSHGWKKFFRGDERHYSLALVLFSLSAHTLNYTTEIQIFAPYVEGMIWYVVLMHLAILVFPYRKQLPPLVQYIVYFINGAGLVLALYLTVFLGPLIPYSIIGAIFLGISLHATVPLWFLIQFIQSGMRMEPLKYSRTAFWAGILTPVLMVVLFMGTWYQIQKEVREAHEMYLSDYQGHLPEWVIVSQHISDDPLVERVLMSDSRAQRWFWDNNDGLFDRIGIGHQGMIQHDPLALFSQIIHGPLPFDDKTIIHILESRYDVRHMTHRRLWRGTDLQTRTINTDIQVFPEYRLAYVEKVLTIHNASDRHWRPQEAVYTFYLPEGSVASSLSLWIEGEERKSRLTTRGKADSAYVQIVGVESRDPALLHWQEGNRITVTVFPCTTEEDRKFKIGFTVPLSWEDDRLFLPSIPFDGPGTFLAESSIDVSFTGGKPKNLWKPLGWNKEGAEGYSYQGKYTPDWELSFEPTAIASEPFSFGGNTYQMQSWEVETVPISPQEIILDINRAWNWFEMAAIWKRVKDQPVYVFMPEKTRLTKENYGEIFKTLQEKNFSLLPLHMLNSPEQTLIISHSPENSPMLADLEGSHFAEEMESYLLQAEGKAYWFNLGNTVSPYLRSLREFRMIHYYAGPLVDIERVLETHTFPQTQETDHLIALQHSGVQILKIPDDAELVGDVRPASPQETHAPDHLLRLFAYNELMRDIGKQYYDRSALENQWVRKAEEAYIVSPVSSLVVLESKTDYERFGIDENENTLGNASLGNSGAVPEPHEWALILLVAMAALWVWKKKIW